MTKKQWSKPVVRSIRAGSAEGGSENQRTDDGVPGGSGFNNKS